MKLSEAILVKPLIEKLITQEMRSDTAVRFAVFAKEVLTVVRDFEIFRASLFEKYGEQVDDGGNWQIKEENEKKFKAAVTRAMDKELDIEPFDMSNSGLDIVPADLINVLSSIK